MSQLSRTGLLIKLEQIIGSSCYNENIQNWDQNGHWLGEGRSFRYPIRIEELGSRKVIPSEIDKSQLLTGHYAFGANQLHIFRALEEVLEFLETEYSMKLPKHEVTKQEQSPVKIECKYCGKLVVDLDLHVSQKHSEHWPNYAKQTGADKRIGSKVRCSGCGSFLKSLNGHNKKCPNNIKSETSSLSHNTIPQKTETGFRCLDCNISFSSSGELKAHDKRCPYRALRAGPSFKNELPRKLLAERRKLVGAYEWALTKSNKATPDKLKKALKQKTQIELGNEVLRLERLLAFNKSPASVETELKRQIAYSHALNSVLSQNTNNKAKTTKAKERKQAMRKMKQKLKPDIGRSEDIMDQYFGSGSRVVVSGGLPSLGRKR